MEEDHDQEVGECTTAEIPLCGNDFKKFKQVKKYINEIYERIKGDDFTKYNAWFLVTNYGIQTETILGYYSKQKGDTNEIRLALAELHFCIEFEMVQNPMDFFIRRTGRLYFDIESVRQLMEPVLLVFKKVYAINDSQIAAWRDGLHAEIEAHSNFSLDRG